MSIQKGASVWLKSGGPEMTVKFKTAQQLWLCTWFVGFEVKEHSFEEDQLTETEPDNE